MGSYGSWKGQDTFISGKTGRQGCDDLILGVKTAATPELEGIFFSLSPGVPELILLALMLLDAPEPIIAVKDSWCSDWKTKSPPSSSKVQVRKVRPQGKLQCSYQKTGERDAGQTKSIGGQRCYLYL